MDVSITYIPIMHLYLCDCLLLEYTFISEY